MDATGSGEPPSTQAGLRSAIMRLALSPYTMACVGMLFWAGSNIVVRAVRDEIPPMGLSFWRTLAAFLVVLPFVWARLRTAAPVIRANWAIIALLAFLLMIGGNAVLFLSLQFTTAINVAIINSVEPLFIVLAAWLFFRDRLTGRQGYGVAVSMVGVLVLVGQGDLATLAAFEFNAGDILVCFAYLSWACYAALLRLVPRGIDHLSLLALLLGGGSVMLLPFYLVENFAFRPTLFTWTMIVSALALACFTSIIAVQMWNRTVAALGPARAGLFIHLIAVYGVILSIIFLDERLEEFHVAGILLIGIGIYLANSRRRAAAETGSAG
jgi:drug/metabolite transporter (DMT)-like permease